MYVWPNRTSSKRNRNKRVDCVHSCDELEMAEEASVTPEPVSAGCFVFPPPPPPQLHPRRPVSACSYCYSISDSDSQSESGLGGQSSPITVHHPLLTFRGYQSDGSPVALHSLPHFLPPIGVFWDIENCQVPKGRSAVAVAQVIRDRFFSGYREAEFLVVCDVKKENSQVIQELNDAQVNLIHVASTCKNAADEKLRQSIRRFADIHGSPAAIILISGDINFAADLNDLRHRKKFRVILLHNSSTSEALILCASEHYNFNILMEDLPLRGFIKSSNKPVEVIVSNLPEDKDQSRIRNRLKQLSVNCGGRVVAITKSTATIRFSTGEFAARAQKRMDGEDVFGRKITVGYPNRLLDRDKKEGSPVKTQSVRKQKCVLRDEAENQQFAHTAIGSTSCQRSASLSSFYHSAPIGHNVLSSVPVPDFMSRFPQNGWKALANGNTVSGALSSELSYPAQNQENYWYGNAVFKSPSAECIDLSANSRDNSRSQSPLTAGAWRRVKESATEELKMLTGTIKHEAKTRIITANGNTEKTPEGYRRIKGTHRVCVSDENSCIQQYQEQHTTVSSHQPISNFNTIFSSSVGPYSRHQATIRNNGATGRNCRTPSPYTVSGQDIEGIAQRGWPVVVPTHNITCSDTEREELEHYFHPISSSKLGTNGSLSSSVPCSNPIVLQITNLDQNIDAKELKRMILSVFREHVMVLHVSVFVQSDGNYAAHVKVPSLQDAQYAISQLHRRKVGYKRILISYANSGGPSPQLIRSQIISLLLEVPGHCLPLFKFRELFESRYLTSISMSDMYKMKDVCLISEDLSGRMVTLNPDHRNTPSPIFPSTTQDGQSLELPYCIHHSRKPGPNKGWAEQEMEVLPNVRIGLKAFAVHIHILLQTHNGSLPLPSLPNCYEAQFGTLAVDDTGVPLEHLVSCLPGIEIYQGVGCVKYLRGLKSKGNEDVQIEDPAKCVSPPLATQLALFSRELVDLLKTSPHCQLLFSRFIPAYHHHFGRQCRVADYGFTKLIDLMEALPHIVQVMGEGNKRVITLSHRAQVRRFTSDLLRILKSQASKQVTVSEFPVVYQRVFNRLWDIVDYGVCEFRDMLGEVSENTIVVSTQEDADVIISIPKREQTPEEIEKTKQFAGEVVELLRHAPQCSMLFNKFIPAYHHHYGHQCRVADYGFTKLIELFEAIPQVAKVEEDGEGERKVTLTLEERLRVLAEQISALVHSRRSCMSLSALSAAFLRQHGYALKPEAYQCSSLEELIQCLHHSLAIVPSSSGLLVTLVDRAKLHQLSLQARKILMEQPSGKISAGEFLRTFWNYFNQTFDMDQIDKQLAGIIQVTKHGGDTVVELTPIQMFARNIYLLLFESEGRLPLSAFESAYFRMFGIACQPTQFGHSSVISLLQSIPDTVLLRGRANKKTLVLNKNLASVGIPLPANFSKQCGPQNDDNDLSSGDSEVHPVEASQLLASEGQGVVAGTAFLTESKEQLSEAENSADKFLKSILGNGMFDSPSSPKPESQALSEKLCSPKHQSSTWGPMWGGASPPQYAPYCHSTAFSAYTGGSMSPWPKAMMVTPNIMSPAKILLPSHSNPPSLNSSPSYHFPSGCLPHVIPPDPSELPLPQLIGSRSNTRASDGPEDDQWSPKASGDADKDTDHKNGRAMSTAGDSLDSSNVSIKLVDSGLSTPNRTKCKRRLAAQFSTPIEMP
ncbi:meiosis regulator and mRNA stability factor 1 isoform X5 [Cryptotermes secundus]|uniref:meiosis regulator and mRNA stability factor 1 isoform X5 n=1 Tax=Cryptotermes secundus TaxID=105785 RepID=UPI000CD7BAC3|nr:meiosis regulator and mRNA stability factor 1 isoform X5 [Cryptotermes secundus]